MAVLFRALVGKASFDKDAIMVYEVAHIQIDPVRAEEFENAVAEAAPLFKRAVGCRAMSLEREIEDPSRYRLRVQWDSVDNHMVDFRNSDGFQRWRALAGPFFASSPVVIHVEDTAKFF